MFFIFKLISFSIGSLQKHDMETKITQFSNKKINNIYLSFNLKISGNNMFPRVRNKYYLRC